MHRRTEDRPHPRDRSVFTPRIETRDIFHRMIADELRNGRLSRSRRARIVRYAAQMGLSAVETGKLIQRCRREALREDEPRAQYHALRLVEPPAPMLLRRARFAFVVAGVLLAEWFALTLLR